MVLAFSTSFAPLDKIVMYAAFCNSSTSFSRTGTGIIAYFLLNFNRVRRTDMAAGKPCKITLFPGASARPDRSPAHRPAQRLRCTAGSLAAACRKGWGRCCSSRVRRPAAHHLRHSHALPGDVGFDLIAASFCLASAHIYISFPFLDSLCAITDVLNGNTHLPQSVV